MSNVASYRSSAGETVDEICWRVYGRTAGTVEAVLSANPGLADRGLFLAAGDEVLLPTLDAVESGASLNLW